jgi:L-arabinose isomerase
MGHSYEGMLDMNFDPTAVTRAVGAHVKFVEMCELVDDIEKVTPAELQVKLDEIDAVFVRMAKSYDRTTKEIEESDIEWAAKVAVGLDKLIYHNNLSGFAYYYMGENNSIYERAASNLMVGNSLMTTKGISMAGEGDMKTCLAMYLTSALGCGGSFAELCLVNWEKNTLIVGHAHHPRPEHPAWQEGLWCLCRILHQAGPHVDGCHGPGYQWKVLPGRCRRREPGGLGATGG